MLIFKKSTLLNVTIWLLIAHSNAFAGDTFLEIERGTFAWIAKKKSVEIFLVGSMHSGLDFSSITRLNLLERARNSKAIIFEGGIDSAEIELFAQRNFDRAQPVLTSAQANDLTYAALQIGARIDLQQIAGKRLYLAHLFINQILPWPAFETYGSTIESVLLAVARSNKIPITALENASDYAASVNSMSVDDEEKLYHNSYEVLVNAAERRKRFALRQEIPSLIQQADCGRFMHWHDLAFGSTSRLSGAYQSLYYSRNRHLADRLVKNTQETGKYLSVFGLLHLCGPNNILLELAELGFQIRQVHLNETQ
jgi:uncharacterized protein YbaP (TraB family)